MVSSIAYGHPTDILANAKPLDAQQRMIAVRAVEKHVALEKQDEILRMLGARS